MAGLKALVIIMAIAIIVAGTVLVTLIVRSGGEPGGAPAAVKAPINAAIELPAGARVLESSLDGGRILMRIILAGGGQQILIIDADSGRRLTTHDLTRKGKAP